MKLTLVLIAIVFISTSSSEVQTKKSYKDHKVVSLRIENDSQLKELQALELEKGFVFLDPPVQVNMKLELVIQPEMFVSFNEIATQHQINFEVTTDNLQSWIDEEKPLKSRKDGFAHDKFNTLEEIHEYLDELAEQHQTATVINIGKSYEGRDIKGIKITTNSNNPAIFIEANIHAREWISSAAAMWIANEILTTQDAEIKEVVESLTWYIIPVTNPDGFVYTHDYERLWRKSRSVHNILCHGVDTNRNFGYNFKQGGSSSLACTDTYAGPSAMSEPEAVAIMNFYATIANQTDAYISFHCAAEVILYPMGTSGDPALLHNAQDLYDIAEAASEGLKKKHGSVYNFGNVVELLYVASGSSPDHAYGVYGTPIAYTFELRGGTTTSSRFILPPDEIEANSEEVLDALVAMVVKAKSLGYFQVRT